MDLVELVVDARGGIGYGFTDHAELVKKPGDGGSNNNRVAGDDRRSNNDGSSNPPAVVLKEIRGKGSGLVAKELMHVPSCIEISTLLKLCNPSCYS
jgi:hypothetical protein